METSSFHAPESNSGGKQRESQTPSKEQNMTASLQKTIERREMNFPDTMKQIQNGRVSLKEPYANFNNRIKESAKKQTNPELLLGLMKAQDAMITKHLNPSFVPDSPTQQKITIALETVFGTLADSLLLPLTMTGCSSNTVSLNQVHTVSVNQSNVQETHNGQVTQKQSSKSEVHLDSFSSVENEKETFTSLKGKITIGGKEVDSPEQLEITKAAGTPREESVQVSTDGVGSFNTTPQGLSLRKGDILTVKYTKVSSQGLVESTKTFNYKGAGELGTLAL